MLFARWLKNFTTRRLQNAKRSRTAHRHRTAEQLEVRTLLAAPTATIAISDALINESDLASTFTVIATYSESMDTGTAPTIAFTPDVSSTLTSPFGAWTMTTFANDTYTASYTVADADVEAADVDVGVSGAMNLTAETQVPASSVDAIDIDTVKPTADIVNVTPDPLTGSDAGTVTINFSEAVTSANVTIADFSMTLTTVALGTVMVDLSSLSVTMVTASQYTIDLSSVTADEGEYVLTLTASGSGIKDLAGNDLAVDATDDWVLPSSAASLASGVLTLTDTGTPTDSMYTVSIGIGVTVPFVGLPVLIISDPNGLAVGAGGGQVNNTTIEIPLTSLTGPLTIFGGPGNDVLELDLTGGVLPNGVIFHGGDGTDSIDITNFDMSGLDSYTANYSTVNSGTVQLRNGATVASTLVYDGIEPLSIDGSPAEIILNLPNGNDPGVTLEDGMAADGFMELIGTTFETTTFSIALATSLTINGRGGNDHITVVSLDAAFAGGLTITGGTGDDTLIGSVYTESLNGGQGQDSLTGGDGDDTLTGGSGNDILAGGVGDDLLTETANADLTLTKTQLNGAGSDIHTGMERAELTGGFNGNVLVASAFTLGPVTLNGGIGNDTLTGTSVADSLDGGDGTDVVKMTVSGTVVVLDATLDVNGVVDDLNLIEAVSLIGGNGGDQIDASGFTGRATVFGGSGNDLFMAALGGGMLDGNSGTDTLVGGIGNDSLYGGGGNDALNGDAGQDTLRGNAGDDSLFGDAGNDRLHGEGGKDLLEGGDDNDTLDGGSSDDMLLGEAGNDSLVGGNGQDSLEGGDNDDFLNGNAGEDTLMGDDGKDTLRGGAGNDRAFGGIGDDELYSDNGNDTLSGEAGNDKLVGAGGRDAISGGSGTDFLNGNGGNDTLLGDNGSDTILGGAGSDLIIGGTGDDSINGQGGRDVVSKDDEDKILGPTREIVAAFTFDFAALLV